MARPWAAVRKTNKPGLRTAPWTSVPRSSAPWQPRTRSSPKTGCSKKNTGGSKPAESPRAARQAQAIPHQLRQCPSPPPPRHATTTARLAVLQAETTDGVRGAGMMLSGMEANGHKRGDAAVRHTVADGPRANGAKGPREGAGAEAAGGEVRRAQARGPATSPSGRKPVWCAASSVASPFCYLRSAGTFGSREVPLCRPPMAVRSRISVVFIGAGSVSLCVTPVYAFAWTSGYLQPRPFITRRLRGVSTRPHARPLLHCQFGSRIALRNRRAFVDIDGLTACAAALTKRVIERSRGRSGLTALPPSKEPLHH